MSLIDAYPTKNEIIEGKLRKRDSVKLAKSESDPIGVFLVTYGARGEKLLFRYPYDLPSPADNDKPDYSSNRFKMKNSLVVTYTVPKYPHTQSTQNGILTGYPDRVLANILAPTKPDFCGQKFEVKINDVIFVGYPVVLNVMKKESCNSSHRSEETDFIFNVVFALQSVVSPETIATYQDLSHQLAVALCHEELRVGYMSRQKQIMLNLQDECSRNPEDASDSCYVYFSLGPSCEKLLELSTLARSLKRIYDDICSNGSVKVYINNWISVSLCLEPKVHGLVCHSPWGVRPLLIKPQVLHRCVGAIRSYHAVLLTEDERVLLESLPFDASPALVKLLKVSSPVKNLQSLASEADIDIRQVLRLVASLVYWGKALIVFPLSETNIYMVTPPTNAEVNSMLALRFQEQFPGLQLPVVLAEFSLPFSLKEHRDALGLQQNTGQDVQVVVWLLRHRLIYQVHTFVYLVPKDMHAGKGKTQFRLRGAYTKTAEAEEEEEEESEGIESNHESEDRLSGGASVHRNLLFTSELNHQQQQHRHHQRRGELFVELTAGERQSILACTAASSEEDVLLLKRLSVYFNGRYHLEAIMFFENMKRSQIVALIDKFRDVLLLSQHEEADISYWIYI